MEGKITIIYYLVEDKWGNRASVVCEDPSDDVELSDGIFDKDHQNLYSGDQAFKLTEWCINNGLKLKSLVEYKDIHSLFDEKHKRIKYNDDGTIDIIDENSFNPTAKYFINNESANIFLKKFK